MENLFSVPFRSTAQPVFEAVRNPGGSWADATAEDIVTAGLLGFIEETGLCSAGMVVSSLQGVSTLAVRIL